MTALRAVFVAGALLALAACKHGEEVGTISGPPLLVERPDASAPVEASAPDAEAPLPPVTAELVDVDATGFHWDHVACEERVFAGVTGHVTLFRPATATAKGAFLGAVDPGDVVVVRGKGGYDVRGPGTVVRAIVRPSMCEPDSIGELRVKTFLGRMVKPLVWSNGAMKASLMLQGPDAELAYVGFLEGTAPVAEHVHEASWEILCAISASGDFTILGQKHRLEPKTCVAIPPNTKHSWNPDPGSTLRAVQFYSPSGPEQRFRGLADAGK